MGMVFDEVWNTVRSELHVQFEDLKKEERKCY